MFMSRRPVRLSAVLAAALLAACADRVPLAPSAPAVTSGVRADLAPATEALGQYLVGVEPDGAIDPAALAASGGRIVDSIPALHLAVVDGVSDPTPLVGAAGVRYVERSYEVTLDVRESPAFEGAAADEETEASPAPAWFASGIQWNLRAMRADRTIAAGNRGAGMNVCILDSGIDQLHQELSGKVVASESFLPNSPAALDSSGHGTHVAGSAAARGVIVYGVAPDANLMAAKVFNATGGGATTVRILNAIRWCSDNGAHVINMSLGGIVFLAGLPATSDPEIRSFSDAVRYANERGTVVVVAAGNENLRLPNAAQTVIPAQVPGTIIVGATGPVSRQVPVRNPMTGAVTTRPKFAPPTWDPFEPAQVVQGPDGRAFYSNFGVGVDVFAPGGRGGLSLAFAQRITTEPVVDGTPGQTARVQHGGPYDNIWSTCSQFSARLGAQNVGGVPGPTVSCRTARSSDRYASLQGTSMAAPHVAGLAAIVYEVLGGVRSPTNRARVEQCIRTTADDIGASMTFGGGRVNAERAVACARS